MHLIKAVYLTSFFRTVLAQGALTINTPSIAILGEPLLVTWSGGTPPYFISILPGNQAGAAALQDLGQVTGNSLTWTVNNFAPGTSLLFTLRDSTGATTQSVPFTIMGSPDTTSITTSNSSPLATTLITTSDSVGNNFTITGVILTLGTTRTTIPCRTVITTDSAGITVTSTETGSSILPTQLQRKNTSSNAFRPSVTASPSIATLSAGAGMPRWSDSALLLVGLPAILIIILALGN